MDGMKKSVAKGLALALVAAMVQAAVADGFVRKREARNYMPTYGNYQHESDVNETMRENCLFDCDGIPPNAFYTMMETIPGTTNSCGYFPDDLTCGGEFYIPPHIDDVFKTNRFADLILYDLNLTRQRRAIIATNEWLCPLERVEPWPELKAELLRYKMSAYEIDFWGWFLGALVFESPVKSGKLPLIVYIPGDGEIGENLTRQFNQRKLFDRVSSKQFQARHPCHLMALSPPEDPEDGNLLVTDNVFRRRAYRLLHKVAREVLKDRVDWSRIYLVGFSSGANQTLEMALDYPSKYAAGIFVAPMIPPIHCTRELRGDDMPPQNYWCVCNEDDLLTKYEDWQQNARDLSAYVNSHGGDCRVSLFPRQKGHDAWSQAWDCEELWDWLFSKRVGERTAGNVPMQLPDARCSASVAPDDPANSADRAADLLRCTYYSPERPFSSDDWWEVKFARALVGRIEVISGDSNGRRKLASGFVECSSDGAHWRQTGVFSKKTGVCDFRITKDVRHLRVRIKNSGPIDFAIRDVNFYPAR